MRNFIFGLLLLLSNNIALADTPDASIDKVIWTCSKDGDTESLMMFYTSETYKHDSKLVLFIDDQQVCNSLGVTCPFEKGVYKSSIFPNYEGKFMYEARKVRQRDGVMFSSKDGGMKLHSLYIGNRVSVNWNKNWFFKYGQCIKHN